jgi:undecaprenyl-diphosphatase
MIDTLSHVDTQLFLFFNGHHSGFWDIVMWHISGKWEWIPFYIFLLYFVIRKYKLNSIWILLSIALVIALADSISSQIIKDSVHRLRPSHNPGIESVIHIVNNYRGGTYGFVSSHAANTFAVAVFLSLLFKNRWFGFSIFIWATIVSYSRIYIGVHYPGDVLGGAILGSVLSLIVFKIYSTVEKRYIKPPQTQ